MFFTQLTRAPIFITIGLLSSSTKENKTLQRIIKMLQLSTQILRNIGLEDLTALELGQ